VPFIHGWPPTNALRIDLQFSPMPGLFASANDLFIRAGGVGPRPPLPSLNRMNAMPMLVDPKNLF
jgi:hypothetical protein